MIFKPKILVVEDETAMLHLLGEVLGSMGAEPQLAASSVQASELIEHKKFDGVFLDLRMPEIDGLELARRIRRSKLNAHVPLVIVTGVDRLTAVKESFDAGANFYLQKPVTPAKIRQVLNASRGMMLEERRRYQRAPVSLRIRCRWEGGQAVGQSVNLSASGVSLNMDGPPPEGTEVILAFELPGNPEPLRLTGNIVRVNPDTAAGESKGFVVGIKFHDHQRRERKLIGDFVEKKVATVAPAR